jgi:hypothetical protein
MSNPKSYLYDDYIQLPGQEFEWLIDPIVPVGGKVLIYAESKVGKSFAALQLAAAVSGTEPDWLGLRPNTTGPVLYIQLDTPSGIWKERIRDSVAAGDLKPQKTYFADKETFDWPFDITNPDNWVSLRTECDRIKPVMVIIDVIREFHGGNEDKNDVMREVIQRLEAAVRPAALVLIGHNKKPNAEYPSNLINGWRGSNYVPGSADTIIKFVAYKGGQIGTMTYEGRKAKRTRVKLQRTETGTWVVREEEEKQEHRDNKLSMDEALIKTLLEVPDATDYAKAQHMATLTGQSFDSCKGFLKRSKGRKKSG